MSAAPAPSFWRSRTLWHSLGYGLSAAWMAYVLIETQGNARAPLFNYIFIGPLALWGGGLLTATILKRVEARAARRMPPPGTEG
ncbi:MAG: hypothetical protein AB7G15_11870 [Alphaproteobacteria bacterium]